MKKVLFTPVILVLFLLLSGTLHSQSKGGERLTVPLSDPSRPAFLKIGLISGGITVKGTSGKDVIVEGTVRHEEGDEDEQEAKERRKGLHRIPNPNSGLTAEEDDNVVTIGAGAMLGGRALDLTVEVPSNSSMKLTTINDGDIEVSNVKGDVEISNTNGSISLSGVNGSAVLDALNGNITVIFAGVTPDKSMSFSSLNGTIDVTFPANLKARMKMKTEQGEIYSDFDIKMETSPAKVEDNSRGRRGKYRVSLDKMMTGTVNGGGPEMQFKNLNGDIYIRKGK